MLQVTLGVPSSFIGKIYIFSTSLWHLRIITKHIFYSQSVWMSNAIRASIHSFVLQTSKFYTKPPPVSYVVRVNFKASSISFPGFPVKDDKPLNNSRLKSLIIAVWTITVKFFNPEAELNEQGASHARRHILKLFKK